MAEKETLDMTTITDRATKAAALTLYRQGFELLDWDFETPAGTVDLVALDDGDLVFVYVQVRYDYENGFPPVPAFSSEQRDEFEKVACWFLHDHEEYLNMPVRADLMYLVVVNESQAMTRHYTDWSGQAHGEKIKLVIPLSEEDCEAGSGEECRAEIVSVCRNAECEAALVCGSARYPGMTRGTTVPVELRDGALPVVPYSWIKERYKPSGIE